MLDVKTLLELLPNGHYALNFMRKDPERNRVIFYGADITEQLRAIIEEEDIEERGRKCDEYINDIIRIYEEREVKKNEKKTGGNQAWSGADRAGAAVLLCCGQGGKLDSMCAAVGDAGDTGMGKG